MRFAHIADCHLGAWSNHPELRELPLRAFATAVNKIINERLDFVLLAGDFFDSSMPAVDVLRFAARQLMRLKGAGIPVYAIAGSHDYSPTGKTMLGVLEEADLLKNAHMKWVEDKSGARIFGVEGLKGGLDREYFESVNSSLSNSERASYNILMLHTAVDEISGMKGVPLNSLPKGFDYYAAGHVHMPAQQAHGKGVIIFPGPLFPTEFSELEKLGSGSFCITDASNGVTNVETELLKLADVRVVQVNCNGKMPHQIESEFLNELGKLDVGGAIVLLKANGMLASGKPTDINWKTITERAQSVGALAVKRSVHLSMKEVELTKSAEASGGLEQIEKSIVEENTGADYAKVCKMMDVFSIEKAEDEKNTVYDEKIKAGMKKVMGLI